MENIKKNYTRVGLSLFVVVAITVGIQLVVSAVAVMKYGEDATFLNETWFTLLLSCVPLHLIAIPIGAKMMKKVPLDEKQKNKLSVKEFFKYLLMCFPLMYGGNIIGNVLSNLLTKGAAQNPLNSIVLDDNILLKIFFVCICAPVFEELLFRKLIIDHTRQYGEKVAIFFSAIAFGLFHMNLFQFFYAFLIGALFAYVYAKTKDIKYSMIMHSIINFMGSIIAPFALQGVDLEFWSNTENVLASSEEVILSQALSFIPLLIYAFALLLLSIIGFVMLMSKRKEFVFEKTENDIPKNEIIKTVYLNYGTILFELLTIGFTIFRLLK